MQSATSPLPPGEETHLSQRSICREYGIDPGELSKLIASGDVRRREWHGRTLYRTEDLTKLAAERRARIVARAARMGPEERRKLIYELTDEHARVNGRSESREGDRLAAEKRIESVRLNVMMGRMQLRAERIDVSGGIIRGATVAQAGVRATGKTYTAPNGKAYPVFTDEETLNTLMEVASGTRKKVREDHVDEVGSRAGFAENFRRDGDRVVVDIHLFTSYRNRSVVLEAATRAADQIGLSIDFLPTFDVRDGKAFMRVLELNAVDIVDQGAVTPNGFL